MICIIFYFISLHFIPCIHIISINLYSTPFNFIIFHLLMFHVIYLIPFSFYFYFLKNQEKKEGFKAILLWTKFSKKAKFSSGLRQNITFCYKIVKLACCRNEWFRKTYNNALITSNQTAPRWSKITKNAEDSCFSRLSFTVFSSVVIRQNQKMRFSKKLPKAILLWTSFVFLKSVSKQNCFGNFFEKTEISLFFSLFSWTVFR